MNRYNIYWLAEKKKELFAVIRPSGTTGNLRDDCDAKTFSLFWSKKKGVGEVNDYGCLGGFCKRQTESVCIEKMKEQFKRISLEEASEKYPRFFKDFEQIMILSILKGHE